jgi:8-oxo-dGTP pyrophosphatase MutT (NUDIX family)/N-acetylglutamate synthase-like GNAT family acetyltransferase
LFLRPQLSSIRARFGYPYHQWMTQEFDEQGWNLVQKSVLQKRAHDVTMLIEGPDGRFALMSKHSYPPGIFRSPSGGVKPGEDIVTGALREAKEETGLRIDLKRFILHITLDISFGKELTTWDSYIFHATTKDTLLKPTDLKEVRDTNWASRGQLQAMAMKLKETGNGGLNYRGDLTAASLWTLEHNLVIREATERDLPGIDNSLIANRLDIAKMEDTLWWIAEVQGLSSGTVGITAHEDCVELVGLTVDPLFRGRGLGHAMVEYACDQWHNPEKRKKFSEKKNVFLNDKLWLTTPTPGYFLPANFVITDRKLLPKSLQDQLTGPRAKWAGMRYQLYKIS